MEASQDKRKRYAEEIKDITIERLVYIDESGIDIRICKDRGLGKKGKRLLGKNSGKYYQRTNIIVMRAIFRPNMVKNGGLF